MKTRLLRFISFVICLALVISLCGCGSTSDNMYINTDWTYGQVAMGGGGFVNGVFSTTEEGLYYCRTDVGGAYRYDSDTERWVSLGYWVTEEDRGLLGIDGLASDPTAPNNLYLLAGTEYFSGGKTAILVSNDYGDTFEIVEVTDLISAHGNGYARYNGERIAVDPNTPSTVYCGGRTGGLIVSRDSGKTWAKVESFPVTRTDDGNGINSIVIEPKTGYIYISVSRMGDDNVYVSKDNANSFEVVKALPTDLIPQRLRLDNMGNLYVTYGNGSENGGGIRRFNIASETVDDISPETIYTFGDIVIHHEDNNKLFACTYGQWKHQSNDGWGDLFYVSVDGGISWTNINEIMTMGTGGIEWIAPNAIHWCGCLMIDPYNPGTIMVISGNGLYRSDNIWDEVPHIYFFAKGIEETVPLDCVSIPGGVLFSAIGDYDGFEHTDVAEFGRIHTERIGCTTGIAAAALNPDVRAKVGDDPNQQELLYSTDGGESWSYIRNKPNEKLNLYSGYVTLTADGSNLLWSPASIAATYVTDDFGETWNRCKGLESGQYIIGDPVDSNVVYAFGNSGFHVSHDGGFTFELTSELLAANTRLCVLPGTAGTVYVPVYNNGLFVTTDFGKTFEKLDVFQCDAIGSGIGKTKDSPLALYMWGRPDESDAIGIYMSEDSGKSWVRINDDLHHFGGPGNGHFIVGDMNVYGRCYMSTVGLGLVYCDKIDKG